eukprot:scaffold27062_cov73-Isochrysis_galbana.AAC.1
MEMACVHPRQKEEKGWILFTQSKKKKRWLVPFCVRGQVVGYDEVQNRHAPEPFLFAPHGALFPPEEACHAARARARLWS